MIRVTSSKETFNPASHLQRSPFIQRKPQMLSLLHLGSSSYQSSERNGAAGNPSLL